MKASSYLKSAVATSAVLLAVTALSTSVHANNDFYQVTNVQYDDALNIRSGAGTNYPVIGSIPANGRTILTTGNTEQMGNSTWTEVVWLGQIGWVNNHFLSDGAQQTAAAVQPVVQEVQPQQRAPAKIDYSRQVAAANNANSHTHPANRCTRTITHVHPNGVATHRHNYSCQKNESQTQSNAGAHTHPRNKCTNSITHNHANGTGAHNHRYECQPAQQMARPKFNPRPKYNQ